MTKVNICGIEHEVISVEDTFNVDTHFGMIDYLKCQIKINKNLFGKNKEETICHEMIHGILVHTGNQELANDELFVQSLANAIMQGFDVRYIETEDMEVRK